MSHRIEDFIQLYQEFHMNKQNPYFWIDVTQTRYFLTPVDCELIEGEFIVQMINGTKKKVDFATIAPFEVTEEAAIAYLETKVSDVLDHMDDASTKLLGSVSQSASESAQRSQDSQPIINSVAALLNTTPAILQQTPTLAQAGLSELLGHMKAVLSQTTIDDAEVSEISRSQLNILHEAMQSKGMDLSKVLESIPTVVEELGTSADDERVLAEVVAILPDLLQQLERSPTNVGELLNQMMLKLFQRLEQSPSDEEKAKIQKEQQQVYEQSAQEAITSVLDVPPVPSLESLMRQSGYLK